ncbi:hypothetical protein U8593_00850 [Aquirufa antheringensis]
MGKSERTPIWMRLVGLIIVIGLLWNAVPNDTDSNFSKSKSTPKTNEERVSELQSGYDGSIRSVVKFVKNSMNDPDSFEHVETRTGFYEKGNFIVSMKYRGKNPFGGVITKYIDVKVDYSGNVISVEKDY